ncbi:hypothetical protein DAEQUDRAFT_672979 [Daedalea quercina L-15889]|uniref:BTB domain-containing protein n=1 Tax=Daedalea quercina L-15889 TaxID=1314783 RepID=A0A165P2I5_9APHY|nr:hypothetical protein DAEQUDRAFT_672979 [Daedalea quercina L-15889]
MAGSLAVASPTRGASPADLQNHLYQSFLARKTADVALRIRGSWHAIYRLHRVVLIQAGYFQSLFTAGFSESKSKLWGRHTELDVIDIVLDDPNITRAGEACIARLYGGGPPLHLSPDLVPTPSQPLTPAFNLPSSSSSSSSIPTPSFSPSPTPSGHQPATPRFLLSLLATASFLGMPAAAAHALQLILASVGPYTAVRYLNFAVGKGIGPADEVWAGAGEDSAAVGLEGVAEVTITGALADPHPSSPEPSPAFKKEAPSSPRSDSSSMDLAPASPTPEPPHPPEPQYYYGAVSDKVGEAAACWLARWGADILAEGKEKGARKRGLTAPPRFVSPEGAGRGKERVGGADGAERAAEGQGAVPVVWRRGDLSARWVRGLLSSDALFVRGERERYDMAKAVVELRRGVPPDEQAEEREWEELFRTGIYYENMSLDDMMTISRDVSPSTDQPYVPLAVLQSAHWNQDVLRHRITARPRGAPSSPSPPLSPSARDKELGLGVSGADLQKETADGAWYPVPCDSSVRIGDSTGVEGANTEQQLLELVSPPALDASRKGTRTCEENFFGLQQQRYSAAAACASAYAHGDGASRFTPHPPFRFCVEFWDVDTLKEKSRLHSHTVWYAGSLYNVYVQVVRKKGVQLGVYLHRQSSVDPLPPCSAPALPSAGGRTAAQLAAHSGRPASSSVSGSIVSPPRPHSSHSTTVGYSSSGLPILPLSRSTTPVSSPASAGLASSLPSSSSSSSILGASAGQAQAQVLTLPNTAPASAPQQPYRDPRPAVSAYFAIACASATGASLTRFTSAPDMFSVSQSWGWKSSSLRTDEYLELGGDGMPRSAASAPARREVSLRATVVLGVV